MMRALSFFRCIKNYTISGVVFGLLLAAMPTAFAQTAVPNGGADGGLTCTGDLNTYACYEPEFCEQYPDNLRCVDRYWCETHLDDDPDCITPEFCAMHPAHERCIEGVPEDCRDYAGAPVSCEPDEDPSNDPIECMDPFGNPVECPDDRTEFCRQNHDSPECLAPAFCEQYPNHIRCTDADYCENNPDDVECVDPEFCRLHPQHEHCIPGEPEECLDVTGAPVPCEPDGEPGNDPTDCIDAFGLPVECPDDQQYCPDGTPMDPLKRCPDAEENKFPGDEERECYDKVPGTADVVAVPCGDPDDGICAHPDHRNDPDCCEEWDPTGQRCLDPNGDGKKDDNGYCTTEVKDAANFSALTLCPSQGAGKDDCEMEIAGASVLVPCSEEEEAYKQCVEKYDEAMCDGDPYNDFTDLPEDFQQREAIIKLGEYCPDYMKIFQGYRDANGNLLHRGGWSEPIIRYDVILVVQRFEECRDLGAFRGDFPFEDVPTDHYAYDAVGESYMEGKTQGYDENGVKEFKGANQVLTTEALKWIMLVKASETAVDAVKDNGMLNPASFAQAKWAMKWWLAAIEWGIEKPEMLGNYYDVSPLRPATRGEVALWLANALGL